MPALFALGTRCWDDFDASTDQQKIEHDGGGASGQGKAKQHDAAGLIDGIDILADPMVMICR